MNLFKIYLFIFSISALAQENNNSTLYHLENRKGKLFLGVGLEYRITPKYNGAATSLNNVYTEIDIQNTGAAFNYNLSYFALKNLSLNFEHSARYNFLMYNRDVSAGAKIAEKTLIMDYNFYVDYYFPINEKSQLFARVGISLFNRGTNHSSETLVYDSNGNAVGQMVNSGTFQYEPMIYAVGYSRDKLKLIAGIYTSSETPYFQSSNNLTIPYLKLTYSLLKL